MAAVDPTGLLEGLLPEQRDIVTTLTAPSSWRPAPALARRSP